ncbi:MAG: hypothetical protein ACFFBQ_09395 [Promethearchaeota archaeon]
MQKSNIFFMMAILILLFGVANRGVGKNSIHATINQPDFSSLGYSVTSSRQGVYKFTTTVEHTGIDPATVGSVLIPWEKVQYDLPLTNGSGTLEETIVTYDLNGDGDILDTFSVTWYNDTVRQWDAIINDGLTDVHAYAITETAPGEWPTIRNYTLNDESKLFSLGSETHFLYRADNYTASFGFGDAYIHNHPGPNFELVLYSSIVTAIDFEIDDTPVNLDFSTTVYSVLDYLTNFPTNVPVYVIPTNTFTINPGEQTKFSCTLITQEETTFEIGILLNWSPDGINRYHWVPVWDTITLEAINRPYFVSSDYSFTSVNSGMKQFEATVENIGVSTTSGYMVLDWGELVYELPLSGGSGTLDENIVNLDLNGDTDQTDTFSVTWFQNSTRSWDAVVDGVHAYAIFEGPPDDIRRNETYYLENGQPKLFQLGSETHSLARADNDHAIFALKVPNLVTHPSPNFALYFDTDSLNAHAFKVNGTSIETNHTWIGDEFYPWSERWTYSYYLLPLNQLTINTGDIVTFSCTLTAQKDVTCNLVLLTSWSPDGNRRYLWKPVIELDLSFVVPVPTSPTETTPPPPAPSTSTSTLSTKTPAFSFLILLIVLPCLIHASRRKKG